MAKRGPKPDADGFRSTPLSVRLPQSVMEKLREYAELFELNITDALVDCIKRQHEKLTDERRAAIREAQKALRELR